MNRSWVFNLMSLGSFIHPFAHPKQELNILITPIHPNYAHACLTHPSLTMAEFFFIVKRPNVLRGVFYFIKLLNSRHFLLLEVNWWEPTSAERSARIISTLIIVKWNYLFQLTDESDEA